MLCTTCNNFNTRTAIAVKIRAVITLSSSQFHTTLTASVTVFLAEDLLFVLVSESRTMKCLKDHTGCRTALQRLREVIKWGVGPQQPT